MTVQSPGDSFALWLERHTIDNEGYQHNPAIAAKVNTLIAEHIVKLVELLKPLCQDDTPEATKARLAVYKMERELCTK